MNHHHRSVWDSLKVDPNCPTKPCEKIPAKSQPRRNGDSTINHKSVNFKVNDCNDSSDDVSKKIVDKRLHSESVFEYLRGLQGGDERVFKSVLRTNNTPINNHEKGDPECKTQLSTIPDSVHVVEDDTPSEDSRDNGSMKESSISPDSMEVSQTPLPTALPTMVRVDVKETYQFAFVMDNDPSSMAIPECADSFEASYQIQATVDKNGAMDIPVNFEPQLFLTENRSSFEEFLQDAIDSFLHEVQAQVEKSRQLLHISNQLACHEESVKLRHRALDMMSVILPDLTFQPRFDYTSPHLERFLDYVVEILNDKASSKCSEAFSEDSIRECFVDLCNDPVKCLAQLKLKILQVVRLLLPHLTLPESFDVDKDISDLMKSITQCAR